GARAQRYTAARWLHTPTARTPPSTPLGLSQLRSTSPAPTRVGTRPEAIAPVAAPRKNGVTTEERAKAAPKSRRSAGSVTDLRKAKAEPRRMTPKATAVSGTESVAMIAANAEGNAVHTTTRAK